MYIPEAHDHDTAPTQHKRRLRLLIGSAGVVVLILATLFTLKATRADPRWTTLSNRCPDPSAAALASLGFGAGVGGGPVGYSDDSWYSCSWRGDLDGPILQAGVNRYTSGILTDPDDEARRSLTDGLSINFHRIGPQTADKLFGNYGMSGRTLIRAVGNLVIEVDFTPGPQATHRSDTEIRTAEQSLVDSLVQAQG